MKLMSHLDECKHFSNTGNPDCRQDRAVGMAILAALAPRCCLREEAVLGQQDPWTQCNRAVRPLVESTVTDRNVSLKMLVVGCVYGTSMDAKRLRGRQAPECVDAKRLLKTVVKHGTGAAAALYHMAGDQLMTPLTRAFLNEDRHGNARSPQTFQEEIEHAPGRFWSTNGPTPAPIAVISNVHHLMIPHGGAKPLMKVICKPGRYMLIGFREKCALCPVGKYSTLANSESCDDCGALKTTSIAGASDMGWCFEDRAGEANHPAQEKV
jgi:hypothetical protein